MTVSVQTTPPFENAVKELRKKYPKIRDDLSPLIQQLKNGEHPGDKIPNVGHDVYKVRVANPSAGRGKSGGFRVIYYVKEKNVIRLIMMYNKTQRKDISPGQIRRLIEEYSQ